MKKNLSALFIFAYFAVFMVQNMPVLGQGTEDTHRAAIPVVYSVSVNEQTYKLQAYSIDDEAYFKLRDVAFLLNRTLVEFSVSWDELNHCVQISDYKGYVENGDELMLLGDEDAVALPAPAIYDDGNLVERPAYLIHGSTYQRFDDIVDYAPMESKSEIDTEALTASIAGVYTQDHEYEDSFSLTLRANEIDALLNGEAIAMAATPFIQNDTFYFPLESVTNLLGGQYSFKDNTARVALFGIESEYQIGSHSLVINGESYEVSGTRPLFRPTGGYIPLDESFCPILVNNLVFIPVGFQSSDMPYNYLNSSGNFLVFHEDSMVVFGGFFNEYGVHEVKLHYTYAYLPDEFKSELTYGGVVDDIGGELGYDVEKYYNDDIEIYVMRNQASYEDLERMDGKVCAVKVMSSRFSTLRGLRVGDTEDRVDLLYGRNCGWDMNLRHSLSYTAENGILTDIQFRTRYYRV